MGIDRDVELKLTSHLASLEATINGFAKDVTRRLERIEEQTTATNGRVTQLEVANRIQLGIAAAVQAPGVQLLTWRGLAAVVGFAVTLIGGTVSVLAFLGLLR